jgi:phosphatidyl-myo-inositol dimannoside synthase
METGPGLGTLTVSMGASLVLCRGLPLHGGIPRMKILALVTEPLDGLGGIAQYNRDFLTALSRQSGCEEIVMLPRHPAKKPTAVEKLVERRNRFGKLGYVLNVVRVLLQGGRFDLVYCGHINLMPLGVLARWWLKAPLILQIYGVDAFGPTGSPIVNRLATRADLCLAISRETRRRFLTWSNAAQGRCQVLPVTFSDGQFSPGPRSQTLLERYGLQNARVVMTLGRLAATERYKGVDEVLEALPDLVKEVPDVAYLIVGEGSDRPRLEAKAASLGVANRTVFAGRIDEAEKAEHYRLADVYAMPSRGEGFGIVFLEAMASGCFVIGSRLDGGRDALADGALGHLVDPANRQDLVRAIVAGFQTGAPRSKPDRFRRDLFETQINDLVARFARVEVMP